MKSKYHATLFLKQKAMPNKRNNFERFLNNLTSIAKEFHNIFEKDNWNFPVIASSTRATLKFEVWNNFLKINPVSGSWQPIVVSQKSPSANSLARFAPIKTEVGIFRNFLISSLISWRPPSGKIWKPLTREIACAHSYQDFNLLAFLVLLSWF